MSSPKGMRQRDLPGADDAEAALSPLGEENAWDAETVCGGLL